MKEETNRRSFIKKVAIGTVGATTIPSFLFAEPSVAGDAEKEGVKPSAQKKRLYNAPYTGQYLNRIAFPIGGIGAGMFCLEGTGAISHMSVRNNPEIFNEPAMFAAINIKGHTNAIKVLEGQVPAWKKFGQHNAGLGGTAGATWGLPRFENAEFKANFPFANVILTDKDIPLNISIIGWSPFIPTDADNASLPVGGLEYVLKNNSKNTEEGIFSYHSRNFMSQPDTKNSIKAMPNGFVLSAEGTANDPQKQGDFAIYTNEPAIINYCWFRGGWFDGLTMAWNSVKAGEVVSNKPVEKDAPGASLYIPFKLKPGEQKTIRLMMAWYVPNTKLKLGEVQPVFKEKADKDPLLKYHKPWYSSKFKDIEAVTSYWTSNYVDLLQKTDLFTDSFYKSTLPPEVIEAVAANLTILKSPTVLRQYDGRFWAFEGSGDSWGSCHGSCTHVWNYAQAISHLFPSLERSLRDTEFHESQNDDGHQMFRSNLPITPVVHNFHAASDGQLGGIMKVYREWRISGDNEWMANIYPKVQASLDYCIKTWDPQGKGVVAEPHHNTYDIEFWGPTGFATSFYLGALKSLATMGKFLKKDVQRYETLYARGKQFMESELYNGEYFVQKIQWEGLKAPNPTKVQSFHTDYTPEAIAVLEKQGPKYQYGAGCLSDGVMGGWLSRMCGLGDPMDPEKTRKHLLAVHKYNLKTNLREHANPQRSTYAIGNEGGLLLCSWPKGGLLSLPFVYSNEVWTGIEYQVASHLMLMGEVEKGLDIVRACRNRYDGEIRNPFNEYECGHWYARAMSSYGMLEGLTGVRYDAVDKTLHINSKVGDFTSFLSTATGFGTVSLKAGQPSIKVAYGKIPVDKVVVSGIVKKLA
ncbi:GH116 family glycosyl hydrolase [Mucilaginibacter boryungensis]|uniref:Twin-arginine translocation signal domain-containing protein n=1 Tax=Mucilaginibacter boryungensis TaxID=768480 RepID=A0ABR9XEY8_9SPHI|nr:GH116 family glycosyl hydrolase [Mucilaginibacter boryungensis]MBE9665760.1 twin-arginine translocation signal domain-containing protein [Mucilaginibacter boryungensis]